MTCRNAIDGMMKCSNQLGVGTILDADWQEEKLFQRNYMCHNFLGTYLSWSMEHSFMVCMVQKERVWVR